MKVLWHKIEPLIRFRMTSDGFTSVYSICFYMRVIWSALFFVIGLREIVSVAMEDAAYNGTTSSNKLCSGGIYLFKVC